ncbi:MAG: tRNA uridine-5-carboxymethylaminomethyl(34) synthesis enzyme MnmG [Chitinispirillia bacterium]|nr:tRNA uridine-5-carboxymethylaminomethyl(34) synthesis enzyme MnmG [Chitinispirillia bacterium]
MPMTPFDLTVIGAGHAGIEAANIAAKMGASVLLVTNHADLIGQMSCNPAIGGIAKGNLVREIDALGGLMASLIDKAGIQFRMLNASKGSAVWGPRAQADRVMYRNLARRALENRPNLAILQAMVTGINVSGGKVTSITLDNGERVDTKAVVLAAGTFLNGVMHVGPNSRSGGRAGEPPSLMLTESIRALGITSGRLRTCTPPRIDGRTVDYAKLAAQRGDADPWPFSFFTKGKLSNKIVCWAARTNVNTHQRILRHMEKSPLHTEGAQIAGPRYCPSIEEKVVRFGERDGHTLYLEPESLDSHELYANGLFTELPCDVQEEMVKSVSGLEGARIMRPGYGIEYDYFSPLQLRPTLESRAVRGLFFAGQVNGSSGYEEAACQGLVAGINATLGLRGEEPVVLGRDTSYIGVLIDDLVTKGTEEPYRMFTSRAEYRLLLRQDNCDERLMPIGHRLGTITDGQYDERRRFWDRKRGVAEWLGGVKVTPEEYGRIAGGAGTGGSHSVSGSQDPLAAPPSNGRALSQTESASDLLRRPEIGIEWLLRGLEAVGKGFEGFGGTGDIAEVCECPAGIPENADVPVSADTDCSGGVPPSAPDTALDRHLTLGVESDIKYEGFVKKQQKEVDRLRRYEEAKIPDGFSYDGVPGLLTESRQKLKRICPATLGQASRIGGVTPADVSVLAMYLLKSARR